jgi:hypothetical protein
MRVCPDAADLVHQGPSARDGIGGKYLGSQRVVDEVGVFCQCSHLVWPYPINYRIWTDLSAQEQNKDRTWRKKVIPFWPNCWGFPG